MRASLETVWLWSAQTVSGGSLRINNLFGNYN